MIIEKLFGNTFGMIWLVVFMVAVLGLIVFMFVKKDKVVTTEDHMEEVREETNEKVEEIVENTEDSSNAEELVAETSEVPVNTEYEIIESEDGFFRVRKVGSERTLRKLSTRSEAEEYIKAKG